MTRSIKSQESWHGHMPEQDLPSPDQLSQGLALVFGASGYIGSNLVHKLLELGIPVRASARNLEVMEGRDWQGVQLVQADALRSGTLDPALSGVDIAFYMVHSMAAGHHFADLDLEAAANFSQAAAHCGVRRIVYLGGLIPPHPKSQHLRSRKETGDRLRAGQIPVTEIRAGMIVGPGSAAFEVIRDLVNYLPVMLTPRWVQSRSSPIALANLLDYLARIGFLEEAAGKTYDVGGPEVLSYEEIMYQYGEIVGRRPLIIRVPLLVPRLSSYWLKLVTSVPVNIAHALIDGLSQDVIADDTEIRKLIRLPLDDFKTSVRAAMQTEQVIARWVEGSLPRRSYSPEYSYYAKHASGSATSAASSGELWRVITSIGGKNGYFFLNFLWTLRGMLDWLVGGPSFRRQRRDPAHLRVGDAFDAWRVIGVSPGRKLILFLEMKAPGSGVLEFKIQPEGELNRITATAFFHPAGIWGLLYWYSLMPFHLLIFKGITRTIARQAQSATTANP
jgi:uncharacterized protein YbjT (DUF2867 family)